MTDQLLIKIERDLLGYRKAKKAGYQLHMIVENTGPLGTLYQYMMVKNRNGKPAKLQSRVLAKQ